jgi:hypothetical protein
MNHLEDEAELYALGMLEPAERERVDEHVRTCDACAARLGRAENAVAALVLARPARRSRWVPSLPVAVAAACAIAAGALAQQNLVLRAATDSDGVLLDRMVTSHFVHTQFAAPNGVELDAKAIYERHGAWYAIVSTGDPRRQITLVRRDGTRERLPQRFTTRGAASLLSIDHPGDVRAIELDDAGGHAIGAVRPQLEAERD